MGTVQTWKQEFSYKSFTFRYRGHFNAFILPLFSQIKPWKFLLYRVLVSIYVWTWLILSIYFNQDYENIFVKKTYNTTTLVLTNSTTNESISEILTTFEEDFYEKHFWVYYFSNQVYLFICLYFLISTVILAIIYVRYMKLIDLDSKFERLLACCKPKPEQSVSVSLSSGQVTPKITIRDAVAAWSNESNVLQYPKYYLYALWAMFTIIVPLAFSNTIMFAANDLIDNRLFKSIYDPSSNTTTSTNDPVIGLLLSVNINIIGSLIVAFEATISLIPVRIYHFFWPILYVCFYLLVLFLCWLFDRSSFDLVYGSLIDYDLTYQYIWQLVLMFMGFILILHLLHALIYRAKIWFFYDLLKLKSLAPLDFSF